MTLIHPQMTIGSDQEGTELNSVPGDSPKKGTELNSVPGTYGARSHIAHTSGKCQNMIDL